MPPATETQDMIMKRTFVALVVVLALASPSNGEADWPQWGGPNRDFQASVTLGDWPADGPQMLWRQPLGDGYSSIIVVGDLVYTQYRDGEDELVVAFARADGTRRWEHRYAAPHLDGMRMGYGAGPHATPLVVGNRLFAVGATGKLNALDAASGKILWQQDLWRELEGSFLRRGYAASPLAFGTTILLPVGGEGQGMVAFDQATGAIVWKAQDFTASQSSPVLIEVDGRPQVVAFVADEIYGLEPTDGSLLWQHKHPAGAVYNINTPLFDADTSRLFFSSAYGGGSRALTLGWTPESGAATKEEQFHTSRLKVHYTNTIRIGSHVYGASGNAGRIFLSSLDLDAGDLAWKERRIGRANLIAAQDRALALEEDGKLYLVSLEPEGLTIHAETQVVDEPTWTVPALAGDTLFIRNQNELMALRLPTRQP